MYKRRRNRLKCRCNLINQDNQKRGKNGLNRNITTQDMWLTTEMMSTSQTMVFVSEGVRVRMT